MSLTLLRLEGCCYSAYSCCVVKSKLSMHWTISLRLCASGSASETWRWYWITIIAQSTFIFCVCHKNFFSKHFSLELGRRKHFHLYKYVLLKHAHMYPPKNNNGITLKIRTLSHSRCLYSYQTTEARLCVWHCHCKGQKLTLCPRYEHWFRTE